MIVGLAHHRAVLRIFHVQNFLIKEMCKCVRECEYE